jgi:putative membrane protein
MHAATARFSPPVPTLTAPRPARVSSTNDPMPQTFYFILNSIVYTLLGVFLFCAVFLLIDKLTPSVNLWRELTEKQNMAVAIVVGFVGLGICVIIASAMH